MDNISREQLIHNLQQSFQPLTQEYNLDHIGVFEEEGQGSQYYVGYTIKKDGKAYMVHQPYTKRADNTLSPMESKWTIESDKPNDVDTNGYKRLEDALKEI
jgi:hypothetical protein